MNQLETERLLLRRWQESDLVPFAAINADPRVTEFFPSRLTFSQSVKIGWRLGRKLWGQGYAVEAAKQVLSEGKQKEVVPFTSRLNLRSLRVMEKIGMVQDLKGDFDHAKLPGKHWLNPHHLYRWTRT